MPLCTLGLLGVVLFVSAEFPKRASTARSLLVAAPLAVVGAGLIAFGRQRGFRWRAPLQGGEKHLARRPCR